MKIDICAEEAFVRFTKSTDNYPIELTVVDNIGNLVQINLDINQGKKIYDELSFYEKYDDIIKLDRDKHG